MVSSKVKQHPFLNGGGEMGALIRAKDWRHSPLGTPDEWPQSLRTIVSAILNSRFPMFVWWGQELTTIYNDAYCPIAGEKHPSLLGKSGKEGWAEIWDDLGPLVETVFRGGSTWSEDQVLYMVRHGYVEETYFTFSYSPIWDESGTVAGLFCACIETTEKVLATQRIRESERNLRATILQSPVAMCILRGPDLLVEIANDRMYGLWGKGAAQLLNRPIFDGLPEVRDQGLEAILQGVLSSGQTFIANERPLLLPREGGMETVYTNFVYEPFRDGDGSVSGVIVVANDVTEQVLARKRIEESERELQVRVQERTAELENQKNLLNNILVNSSNGISVSTVVRNEEGEVVDSRTLLANDAAVHFIGLPKETYLSKRGTEIEPDLVRSPYFQGCLRTLQTGEPFLAQYQLQSTGKWLELTTSRLDVDHLIHIFTDVTPIKEAQLQLERSVDELKRTNQKLEDFAYAASHDLKEPIRKIHFFGDRLKQQLQESLTKEQALFFERLESAANRMGALVDDLLAYSQATKGLGEVEDVNLNRKVQLVLEDLEVEISKKGALIDVGELPTIKGSKRQMQQLFQNLLTNALKYHKPGQPPAVRITSRVVQGKDVPGPVPSSETEQTFHLVEVQDEGIGFSQTDAERIFNVFTRLHGNSEYSGTGVGLSIVQKVVQNHDGHIWAESSLGAGATFFILLPAG